jgi:hypothetical protein
MVTIKPFSGSEIAKGVILFKRINNVAPPSSEKVIKELPLLTKRRPEIGATTIPSSSATSVTDFSREGLTTTPCWTPEQVSFNPGSNGKIS